MGVCQYCGQSAGWFSDVHEACVRSGQEGSEKVASLIAATLEKPLPIAHPDLDKWYSLYGQMLWAEVKPQIDTITTHHRMPANHLRVALRVAGAKERRRLLQQSQ